MLSFEKRIDKKTFSLKICAASVVSAALLTPTGDAEAKDPSTSHRGQAVKELEAENARLRQQLAATEQERDRLQAALAKPAESSGKSKETPFAMKDLAQGYASTAKAEQKETREMACGAAMAKNPEMKCGAAMKKSPEMACGANMANMEGMEAGSLMQFNPALSGSDFYHVHPKGMWMFNTKFMHMDMRGLQDGAKTVRLNQVFPYNRDIPRNKPPYGYMMAPTYMTMDMFMLMGMVGITDRLTVMGMVNYQTMDMGMLMNMGPGSVTVGQAPMRTYGLADSEIDATYAITPSVFGTLGLSIPTGSTTENMEMMGRTYRAPYDMQNGSGTLAL
ncbi:MAG: hypothetical protein PHE55_09775, partial [Methylococcaceae bacterium]|nr:hypothetical protein [Methylococcaceae bacterium]